MALSLRNAFTHPARRIVHPTGQKTSRAQALDYTSNRAFTARGVTGPKFRDYESYERAYKIAWVRACVQVIAYNAAAMAFRLVESGATNDENDSEVMDSAFIQLMRRPNPYQTGFGLREAWWTDLELTGNAYVALEAKTPMGLPTEIYRLRPSRVTIVPDPKIFIAGYRYTVDGRTVEYAPDEVIHLKYANPLDDYYGMGVIEAGEARFESEIAMSEHERDFWGSGAKIMGIFGTEETLDQPTFDRIKDTIRNFFLGSGYSTLLMEQGVKYQSVSDSPAKLGMLDMAKASRDQILALFGVPATKLGILEKANYKADEADRYFFTETIEPKLVRVEESLQPLVDLFHPDQDYRLRWHRLNFSDDLPQMTVAKTMAEVGVFTADEIRAYTGRDPLVDGRGDVVLAQITTVPLDLGGQMATINERRSDQSLPHLEGGDTTIILPRGSVPLDVTASLIEESLPRVTPPSIEGVDPGASRAPATRQLQPSNISKLHRGPQAANPANTAPTTGPRPPIPAARKSIPEEFFDSQEQRIKKNLEAFPTRAKSTVTIAALWNDSTEDTALAQYTTEETTLNTNTKAELEAILAEGLRRAYSTSQIAEGVPSENYGGIASLYLHLRTDNNSTSLRDT